MDYWISKGIKLFKQVMIFIDSCESNKNANSYFGLFGHVQTMRDKYSRAFL